MSENNFCTLFNSAYLTRGLALYRSLIRHLPDAHLYVVTFDNKSFETLNSLNLPNLTAIRLEDFEDNELLRIKPTRTLTEYCWTTTPSVILYCIKKFNLSSCTYVDADIYFYSSPLPLLQELTLNESVSLTLHNYSEGHDQTTTSGKFCVQFMTFKNDQKGLHVLNWWRDRCIEWCYNRVEDGKFGDQKYLDDWEQRFEGIKVLRNIGSGIAPWNFERFKAIKEDSEVQITNNGTRGKLVFFHFHSLKFFKKFISISSYPIPENYHEIVYLPYLQELEKINRDLTQFNSDFNGTNEISVYQSLKMKIKSIIRSTPVLEKRNF